MTLVAALGGSGAVSCPMADQMDRRTAVAAIKMKNVGG
jgi:hypothetical protein